MSNAQRGSNSAVQVPNVSISLPAQMHGTGMIEPRGEECEGEEIHPACDMLVPQLATWRTASSGSDSRVFVVLKRPSVEPDSRIDEESGAYFMMVISSECVSLWERKGAAGFLGSLE
jgi:hypothetical protein